MIDKNEYEKAISVQNGCSLSGIVHSFAKAMSAIWQEADILGEGTEWVNTHPIAVLYSSKIASLTGSYDNDVFSSAYGKCVEIAES